MEFHLRHLEMLLLRELVNAGQAESVVGAKEHFQGCAQRFLMMRYARAEIRASSESDSVTLDGQEIVRLNALLNSYYINLLGALDNLAWAVTHRFSLLERIDEANPRVRRFCTLTDANFREALGRVCARAALTLTEIDDWVAEVKSLRDPAAHRRPLTMAPGILTEEEAGRYRRLHEEATAALLEERWEDYDSLVHAANQLGRFVPILNTPRSPDGHYYVVPAQIAADQTAFVRFVHRFLGATTGA